MTVERMCSCTESGRCCYFDALESEVHRLLPTLPRENVWLSPLREILRRLFRGRELVQRGLDAIMAVMPSDHFIGDSVAFTRVSRAALEYAKDAIVIRCDSHGRKRVTDTSVLPILFAPSGGENTDPECRPEISRHCRKTEL